MAAQGDSWDVAGCKGEGTDRAATITSQTDVCPTHGTFTSYPFDFDVTALVQDWVDNPSSNHGLSISSVSPVSSQFVFASADYTRDINIRPKLLIRYRTVPTPTPTATVTPTPTVSEEGTIRAIVFDDQNDNGNPDTGEGVAGATVEVRGVTDTQYLETLVSDSEGYCIFADLTPGTYRVRLTGVPDGYEEVEPVPWMVYVGAGATVDVPIALRYTQSFLYLPLILDS